MWLIFNSDFKYKGLIFSTSVLVSIKNNFHLLVENSWNDTVDFSDVCAFYLQQISVSLRGLTAEAEVLEYVFSALNSYLC